jgi:hypothetical protein
LYIHICTRLAITGLGKYISFVQSPEHFAAT